MTEFCSTNQLSGNCFRRADDPSIFCRSSLPEGMYDPQRPSHRL